MRAIQVTCPHCGARLKVGDDDIVTCDYCGTASRIQRRTRILDRVMPPPEAAEHPRPVAVQTPSRVHRGIAIASAATITVGIFAIWFSSPTRSDAPVWQGTPRALLADANGDGVLDIIGRGRQFTRGDTVRVIAIDGSTGKLLWQTEPLGTYLQTYSGPLAIAGNLVLFASDRGEVRAFSLADGTRLWTTSISERVQYFCAGDDTHVLAFGEDDVLRPLARASGELGTISKVPRKPQHPRARYEPACPPLPSDALGDAHALAHREVVDPNLQKALGVHAGPLVTGRGGRVFGAARATGTRVTMLIALDDDGRARWQMPMASESLLATGEPGDIAVGEHEACGTYKQGDAIHLACFALADGTRLWDQAVSHGIGGIHHVGAALVILATGRVEARDPATGALRWRHGQ